MVNDFYEELAGLNLQALLQHVNYEVIHFNNEMKVYTFIDEIRKKNAKVGIISDYDVDGLMSALTTRDGLLALGITNVNIIHYHERMHTIDRLSVLECIQQKYEYCFICDTGSSEMDILRQLTSFGVKVILLDHHNTAYRYSDYPDNVAIINTQIENSIVLYDKFALSAGALCTCIMDGYAVYAGLERNKSLFAYALVSLYADCMDMSNEINRSIYFHAKTLDRGELPVYIQHFMNEYQSFNSRFIGFWFAPRINALFRSERFDIVNAYFFDTKMSSAEKLTYIEYINTVYENDREMVKILADIVDVTELDNFVTVDLSSALGKTNLLFYNLQNYTGLVANKIGERYGKTAIVYIPYENYYKGSCRDLFGRNYLNLFQQLCYAAGHDAAFGLKINALELKDFLYNVEKIDQYYSIETIANKPIIVNYKYSNPDNVLIEDMALYNEFSGSKVPIALLQKSLVGDMREQQTKYYYRYLWGDYFIQSDFHLEFGCNMLLKPIKAGKTKLIYHQ